MPQEFLRDVLRSGDGSVRAQRHWSVLPLSIAGHALVAGAVIISPLAAEVEMPPISSPIKVAQFVRTTAPPSPPPPAHAPAAPQRAMGAPLEAPTNFAPERPAASANPVEGAIPEGIGMAGALASTDFGASSTAPAPAPLPPPPVQPRLVRAGQGVREPKKILHVTPEYPEIAKRARVEGTVVLEAVLDEAGRVDRVRILRSVGLLDDAAVRAVKEWRYSPTQLNGVPIPVLMTITVHFSLER